jgi:hypothetical protein
MSAAILSSWSGEKVAGRSIIRASASWDREILSLSWNDIGHDGGGNRVESGDRLCEIGCFSECPSALRDRRARKLRADPIDVALITHPTTDDSFS